MEAVARSYLIEDEVELLARHIPAGDLKDLMSRSFLYHLVLDEDELVAVYGFYASTLLTDDVVVWLVLIPRRYSFTQRRLGILLGWEILSACPWRLLAEVFTNDRVGQRFVAALGFNKIGQIEDRLIYQWDGK